MFKSAYELKLYSLFDCLAGRRGGALCWVCSGSALRTDFFLFGDVGSDTILGSVARLSNLAACLAVEACARSSLPLRAYQVGGTLAKMPIRSPDISVEVNLVPSS